MTVSTRRARIDTLREISAREVGELISNQRAAHDVKKEASQMPLLTVEVRAQPITRTVLRVMLTIEADFEWSDRQHCGSEPWWIWVEDT